MKKSIFIGLSTAFFAVSTANADQHLSDEIIVTAKNSQTESSFLQSADVFTISELEIAQAIDLPTLIDQIAGISFRDSGGRGSATSVFIRGAANSQIIVLIDGVRVGSATLGAAALNSYPIEAVERVEVIKGPFSSIYGADAAGGVIQIFTKKGGEGNGAISAKVGTDSFSEFGLALNGKSDKFSYHLALQAEDTDGIDRTSILSGGNEDTDGFEEEALSIGLAYEISDKTKAELSILKTDNTVQFDNTFGSDPGLETDTETFSSALNITTLFDNGITWTNTLGINDDQSITNGAFPSDITTNRDSLGSEISLNLSSGSVLTTGVDYYDENIETLADFDVTDRDNKGIYALLTGNIAKFNYAVSARYDDNSAYGSNTNGSASVGYRLNDELRLSFSYGTAFIAPSFNYLYFPNFGNSDIMPEESESAEISLTGTYTNLFWKLTAYQADIENLFSFDPVTFTAANVGEAEFQGLELTVKAVVAQWNLEFNADLLDATDKVTGIELDDRAERTLRFIANRDFGNLNVRFDIKNESGRHDNRGTELSSYTLVDTSAIYQLNDKVKLYAEVDNLFDKDYTLNLLGFSGDRYNTEGRQIKAGFRFAF